MSLLKFSAFVFFLVGGQSFAADTSLDNLLNQMEEARKEMDYQATLVLQQGESMQTIALFHQGATNQSPERERLLALDGIEQEILRSGDRLTSLNPQAATLFVRNYSLLDNKFHRQTLDLPLIRQHYLIRGGDTGRVAGRNAKRIDIIPKDGFRYRRTLWIDAQSNLLVSSEVRDEKGGLVEKMMLTNLQIFDQINPKLLQPQSKNLDASSQKHKEQVGPFVASAKWKYHLQKSAPGFMEQSNRHSRLPIQGVAVDHLFFTDGLASVSVYLEPVETASAQQQAGASSSWVQRFGAMSSFVTEAPGYRVIAVGEVPTATVERIGQAIEIIAND